MLNDELVSAVPRDGGSQKGIVDELRSTLVELLLSLLWVFGSLASSVAAHWGCVPGCLTQHQNYELVTHLDGGQVDGEPMNSMASMPTGEHGSPMCPTATAPVQISMASGFLAAVACGLTTGLARHGSNQHGTLDSFEINTRGGFHPTVALALALRGRLHVRLLLLYVVAQLVGACLAGLLIDSVVGRTCHNAVLEAVHHHVLRSWSGALILQAVLNLTLALIYLWTDRRNHLMAFPIVVGFHYAASFLVGLQMLGLPVLNPTRAFGVAANAFARGDSDLLPTIWEDLNVGWTGAFLGVGLAVAVDIMLFAECLWGPPHAVDGSTHEAALI